jgi:hypothetical protein
MTNVPEVIGAVIETVVTSAGLEALAPGVGVGATIMARYWAARHEEGRRIFRSELERLGATGEDLSNVDEFAAGAVRYTRAVRDQAAAENLRLLVQAMVGLARREKLWASDFLQYADILATLSRDEIVVIGAIMAADEKYHAKRQPKPNEQSIWTEATYVLTREGRPFPSSDYVTAIAVRAQRSGLILPLQLVSGQAYLLSPIGYEVRKVVDIEAALNAGGVDGAERKRQ